MTTPHPTGRATASPVRVGTGAAFFDLDRTLLAGASGEVFSAAMKTAGLVNRSIPGEALLFRLFNTIGETLPSMALARQAVALAKGKSQEAVQAAAAVAAERLLEMIQPLAAALFEEHRAAGRPVVMATTTPYDMVKPLADLLGLDGVIATRYRVNEDGTYHGTLDGPFVWSAGKLAAVRSWADAHGIDLAESYAYSDSVYDTPLLAAVGFPFVVNPDPRMAMMAAARRWPTIDLSEGRPGMARIPVVNMEIAATGAHASPDPLFVPYAKFDIAGVENIPATARRSSSATTAATSTRWRWRSRSPRAGRTVRFLGKKEVFDAPIVGQIAAALGGIRVERGTGSDEPLQAAAEALEARRHGRHHAAGNDPARQGVLRPDAEGPLGRGPAGRDDRCAGDPGRAVGHREGVAAICPPSQRAQHRRPANCHHPCRFSGAAEYQSADADTKRIMKALMDLLPPESRVKHEPTEEELAPALPRGYKGDVDAEPRRRPGTD